MLSTKPKSDSLTDFSSTNPIGLGSDPLGLALPKTDTRKRFLRCSLSQKYNVLFPIEHILEVMPVLKKDILPIPDLPSFILGVRRWQGDTLWLVDLNSLFSYPSLYQHPQISKTSSAVVVQHNSCIVGLVVERASDIDLLDETSIQTSPSLYPSDLEPFVLGYCLQQDSILLSIPTIMDALKLQT